MWPVAAAVPQLLVLAAVVALAAAFMVRRLVGLPGHTAEASVDSVFWTSFLALAVLVPALLISAVADPPAAAVLVFAALSGALAATWRRHGAAGRRRRSRNRRASSRRFDDDATRHSLLVAHWQRYEVDPAFAIDYPRMSDVRAGETALLIRALRNAGAKGRAVPAGATGSEDPGTDYTRAVQRLEACLVAAELAAGVPAAQSWPSGPAAASRQGSTAVRSSEDERTGRELPRRRSAHAQ